MRRSDLYRHADFRTGKAIRVLSSEYRSMIRNEQRKIIGREDPSVTERTLALVYTRLGDAALDESLNALVFDCLRKEILRKLRREPRIAGESSNPVLRAYTCNPDASATDDLRLDIALMYMRPKVRRYFLNRYYYLRKGLRREGYEDQILRLMSGRGEASVRFRCFRIPSRQIHSDQYADYLDRLDPSLLKSIAADDPVCISDRIRDVPAMCLFQEKNARRARLLMPLLLLLLFFYAMLAAVLGTA